MLRRRNEKSGAPSEAARTLEDEVRIAQTGNAPIAVSIGHYSAETVAAMNRAFESGVKVVALTAEPQGLIGTQPIFMLLSYKTAPQVRRLPAHGAGLCAGGALKGERLQDRSSKAELSSRRSLRRWRSFLLSHRRYSRWARP